ncbi:hypothetical protein U1Q18_037609 [Sarracenia purpurea var. burkii]
MSKMEKDLKEKDKLLMADRFRIGELEITEARLARELKEKEKTLEKVVIEKAKAIEEADKAYAKGDISKRPKVI